MLELLNQLDGFASDERIKVLAATNRVDVLDPALLRSGRLDRKIEFPLPNEEARAQILQIHSRKMTVHDGVNWGELARSTDEFGGAQLKAVCVEAGMIALRSGQAKITHEHYVDAVVEVQGRKKVSQPLPRSLSVGTNDMLRRMSSICMHSVQISITTSTASFVHASVCTAFSKHEICRLPHSFYPSSRSITATVELGAAMAVLEAHKRTWQKGVSGFSALKRFGSRPLKTGMHDYDKRMGDALSSSQAMRRHRMGDRTMRIFH